MTGILYLHNCSKKLRDSYIGSSREAMDDHSIGKVQIPGPTLSSLLHRASCSSGDIDGLLFGTVTYLTPTNLSDDVSTSSDAIAGDTSPSLIATVTSFFSSSSTSTFYDPAGQINLQLLRTLVSPTVTLIGWFSSRRKTSLRPSMRESAVASSLSNTELSFQVESSPKSLTLSPCLFLLLTTPFQKEDQLLIHTHDYRLFQFRLSTHSFEPKTLDIINIGPAFRGHYGNFSPNSPFPSMPCEIGSLNLMAEDNMSESDNMNVAIQNQSQLNMCADGFQIARLEQLTGSVASNYTSQLEDMYSKMIAKLNGLAKLVEKSSARVLEQEKHNKKLRYKVAGLE